MNKVNMFEAKTNLSKYIALVENEKEPFIIIMRNGKPVAKIIRYDNNESKKIGIAKGKIPMLKDVEAFNSIDVESSFIGNGELL